MDENELPYMKAPFYIDVTIELDGTQVLLHYMAMCHRIPNGRVYVPTSNKLTIDKKQHIVKIPMLVSWNNRNVEVVKGDMEPIYKLALSDLGRWFDAGTKRLVSLSSFSLIN